MTHQIVPKLSIKDLSITALNRGFGNNLLCHTITFSVCRKSRAKTRVIFLAKTQAKTFSIESPPAAAAAAVANSGGRQIVPGGVGSIGSVGGSGDIGASATMKRRSSNRAGNHLSGERIRQLREEQKMRAAAVSAGGGGLSLPSTSMPATSLSPNALRSKIFLTELGL